MYRIYFQKFTFQTCTEFKTDSTNIFLNSQLFKTGNDKKLQLSLKSEIKKGILESKRLNGDIKHSKEKYCLRSA